MATTRKSQYAQGYEAAMREILACFDEEDPASAEQWARDAVTER